MLFPHPKFLGSNVYNVSIRTGSFFVWFGKGPSQMPNLSLALSTRFSSTPSCTKLFGEEYIDSDISRNLAMKRCQRLGKMCYVSTNIMQDDGITFNLILKYLIGKIGTISNSNCNSDEENMDDQDKNWKQLDQFFK